jgi:hypothetical protein
MILSISFMISYIVGVEFAFIDHGPNAHKPGRLDIIEAGICANHYGC